MNEETIWVLKMLSEKRLSAQMASRLLRALELLKKSEEKIDDGVVISKLIETPETVQVKPEEENQVIMPEKELGEALEQNQDLISETIEGIPENIGTQINDDSIEKMDSEEVFNEEAITEYSKPTEESIKQDFEKSDTSEYKPDRPFNEAQDANELPEKISEVAISVSIGEAVSEMSDLTHEEPSTEKKPVDILENQLESLDSKGMNTAEDNLDFINKDGIIVSTESLDEEKTQEQITKDTADIKQDELCIADNKKSLLAQETGISEDKEEPIIARSIQPLQDSQIYAYKSQDDNVFVLSVANDTEVIFNNSIGNIKIQGWDQKQLKIEGLKRHLNIFQDDGKFNVDINGGGEFLFFIPSMITKIRLFNDSGKINVNDLFCDIFVSSGPGDIYIKNSGNILKAKTISGNIAVENYHGSVRLQTESGSILIREMTDDKKINESREPKKVDKQISENYSRNSDIIPEVNIQTETGDIALENITGSINAKCNGEIIRLKKCRGQNITVESKGGKMNLKDVANNISLKVENGEINIEDFFGVIKIDAKDTNLLLMKSGDAQIHIDNDGGDINIEDCYADVRVDSGKGNINITGGNLSFSSMGRLELRMKTGNAYLARRTFEDVWVSIETGNAEVKMEKLNSGGSGNISVQKGDIKFQISPSFRFDLMAQAQKKKIHLELPIEIIERDKNYLRGTLNNGGAKVNLVAPEGEIFVQALDN